MLNILQNFEIVTNIISMILLKNGWFLFSSPTNFILQEFSIDSTINPLRKTITKLD
jgi:hypothetical protein